MFFTGTENYSINCSLDQCHSNCESFSEEDMNSSDYTEVPHISPNLEPTNNLKVFLATNLYIQFTRN